MLKLTKELNIFVLGQKIGHSKREIIALIQVSHKKAWENLLNKGNQIHSKKLEAFNNAISKAEEELEKGQIEIITALSGIEQTFKYNFDVDNSLA